MYTQGIVRPQSNGNKMAKRKVENSTTRLRATHLYNTLMTFNSQARALKRSLNKEQKIWIGTILDACIAMNDALFKVLRSFME